MGVVSCRLQFFLALRLAAALQVLKEEYAWVMAALLRVAFVRRQQEKRGPRELSPV